MKIRILASNFQKIKNYRDKRQYFFKYIFYLFIIIKAKIIKILKNIFYNSLNINEFKNINDRLKILRDSFFS